MNEYGWFWHRKILTRDQSRHILTVGQANVENRYSRISITCYRLHCYNGLLAISEMTINRYDRRTPPPQLVFENTLRRLIRMLKVERTER